MSDDDWTLDGSPFAHVAHPAKRAFLEAFAETGNKSKAAKLAGVHRRTPHTEQWTSDPVFADALEVARKMTVDLMADAAHTRAVDGVRVYKFDKDGTPLRHPEECRCGHHVEAHLRDPEDEGSHACLIPDCECGTFLGRPYYDHAYSDKLLETLLRSHDPDRFRQVKEVRGWMASIDLNDLPNWAIDAIAKGENYYAVVARWADEIGGRPTGEIGPGAPPEVEEVEVEILDDGDL